MIDKNKLELQFIKAFPISYNDIIKKIINKNIISANLAHDSCNIFQLENETIRIPYRIYIEESLLNDAMIQPEEKRLLLCYFTRYHNGYIRQYCVRELAKYDQLRDYEIANMIMLTGEYVIEIIEDVYELLKKDVNRVGLEQIIANNFNQIKYQHNRMVSYWNEYYRKRRYKSFDQRVLSGWKNYIGSEIISFYKDHGYNEKNDTSHNTTIT